VLDEVTEPLATRLDALAAAGMDALTVELGRRLGLYDALRQGPLTSGEVAAAAGVDERYAREWLEQQASARIIDVDDRSAPPGARRYGLDDEAVRTLTDPDDPAAIGPFFDFVASIGAVLDEVVAAYRTGAGVPVEHYAGFSRIQGDFNRPILQADFPGWLRAVPGLAERLAAPGARVLEFGSGEGWASIAVAQAWPGSRVEGVDLLEESVVAARAHARDAGVGDRALFRVADAASAAVDAGAFELVFCYECLHDLADPVGALAGMRAAVAPGGTVLVFDERVPDDFGTDPVERLMYAFSVLHCLPASRVLSPSAATGTVMRPSRLGEYARAAGFAGVEVLPVGTELIRGYRLVA
jgi:2-polyprenyl-3-methyl-5-hydroxy-6-metoxy-1,4-benzoquinol methylase